MEKDIIDGKVIANNIRAERNRANLTQENTAEKLGISTKTYISYEEDAQCIKATMLYKLAKIFGCTINAFYLQSNST